MKTATAQSSLFPQWTMKLVVCSFEGVQMKSSFELCLILNALIVYSVQKTYQSNMQNKKFQREKKNKQISLWRKFSYQDYGHIHD